MTIRIPDYDPTRFGFFSLHTWQMREEGLMPVEPTWRGPVRRFYDYDLEESYDAPHVEGPYHRDQQPNGHFLNLGPEPPVFGYKLYLERNPGEFDHKTGTVTTSLADLYRLLSSDNSWKMALVDGYCDWIFPSTLSEILFSGKIVSGPYDWDF